MDDCGIRTAGVEDRKKHGIKIEWQWKMLIM